MKCQCCPHIEISQLICYANQLTGFYMRATLAINGLINFFSTWNHQEIIHCKKLTVFQLVTSHVLCSCFLSLIFLKTLAFAFSEGAAGSIKSFKNQSRYMFFRATEDKFVYTIVHLKLSFVHTWTPPCYLLWTYLHWFSYKV